MDETEQRIARIRRFNRFYTPLMGLLDDGYLESPYSLAAVRVLYELAHRDNVTASALARELRLDPGYLSRMLRIFRLRGLVEQTSAIHDRRQRLLRLTERGREAFAPLNQRSHDQVAALIDPLSATEQSELVRAMETVERLLARRAETREPYVLRPPRAGDLGWVVQRHGALYAQEYGWDERFEGLVASVVAEFVEKLDPRRERCWIAERHGENVGSVFVVRKNDDVAKLRLLIVEPSARGLGIGARLVDECLQFARSAGYRRMTLWTNSVLVSARRIYEARGFQLVHGEPHYSFGHDLVGETWERDL